MGPRIWEDFLTIISQEVGSRVVDTWFKAVILRQWDPIHHVVYLEAPNPFVKDWIKTNYLSLIQFHLGRLLQVHEMRVIFLDARTMQSESKELHVAQAGAKCAREINMRYDITRASCPGQIIESY